MSSPFPNGIHPPEAMCQCGHPFRLHWDVGVCDRWGRECDCREFRQTANPGD